MKVYVIYTYWAGYPQAGRFNEGYMSSCSVLLMGLHYVRDGESDTKSEEKEQPTSGHYVRKQKTSTQF
jgi:hypothetical protein